MMKPIAVDLKMTGYGRCDCCDRMTDLKEDHRFIDGEHKEYWLCKECFLLSTDDFVKTLEQVKEQFAGLRRKIDGMTDDELTRVWKALRETAVQDPFWAPYISMDTWMENIYSEMGKRNLNTQV